MNPIEKGIAVALGLCCVWPAIVVAVYEYLRHGIGRRDWKQIQWPWRKDD